MYLMVRFQVSGEFEADCCPDFTKNQDWFDIKLLVDATGRNPDFEKPMSNQSYAKAIKSVLKELGITSNHFVHIGRVMGPVVLEMLEVDHDKIRLLGNWDPKIQETRYSSKLPLGILRSMAGFVDSNGMYYSPRTTVDPPECLQKAIFPWVDEQYMRVVKDGEDGSIAGEGHPTAQQFLQMMLGLRIVLLQDLAATEVLYPNRKAHFIFKLPIFQSDEWAIFKQEMRQRLLTNMEEDPTKATVEAVLPGVLSRMMALEEETKANRRFMDMRCYKVEEFVDKRNKEGEQRLADGMVSMASKIRNSASSGTSGGNEK